MIKDDGVRLFRLVSSIIVSGTFLVTVLGGHLSDPNDEQIIFLLDLMVFEGKEAEAEDRIDKLVENVKKNRTWNDRLRILRIIERQVFPV